MALAHGSAYLKLEEESSHLYGRGELPEDLTRSIESRMAVCNSAAGRLAKFISSRTSTERLSKCFSIHRFTEFSNVTKQLFFDSSSLISPLLVIPLTSDFLSLGVFEFGLAVWR